MKAVILIKKDVEKLGKNLLEEMFNFLHDEYILENFQEMKKEQEKFLKNIALNHINTLKRKKFENTEEKRKELINLMNMDNLEFVKDAMKNGGMDMEGIYQVMNEIELDMEIDEDLYFKLKSFLDIFKVYKSGYTYLEDLYLKEKSFFKYFKSI